MSKAQSQVAQFRTAYDGCQFAISQNTSISFLDSPSKTLQSHSDECDVNKIIASLDMNGFLQGARSSTPAYFDVSQATDYHSALNNVMAAQDAFFALDAHIRKRFNNDPGEFVDFFNDPANAEEAVSLGLATAREPIPDARQVADREEALLTRLASKISSKGPKNAPEGGNGGE